MGSYTFPLSFLCLDVCLMHATRLAQFSPLLASQPLLALWGAGLARALLLILLTFSYPGDLPWMRSFKGLQGLAVLCFLFPAHFTLLWALGWQSMLEVMGCHCWERLLQGYLVTLVAGIYWNQYLSSLLLSCGQAVSSLLRRAPSAASEEARGVSVWRLASYMRPYSGRFVVVVVLVVLSSYGEMAFPQYTGRVADWIMNEDEPDAFTEAITVMTLMTVASAVMEFLCDLTYNITMSRIHASVQGLVFQSVLRQDITFFDNNKPGELVSHVTTNTNTMSEALSEELSLVMWYTGRLVFLLFFMVSQSWKLTLLSCMSLPIIWVVTKAFGYISQSISKEVMESLAKANQVATETFSYVKTVKCFANEDGETEKYRAQLDKTYALNRKEAAAYAGSMWANSMASLALKVGILYYGGTLVNRGGVSSGDLVSFVLYELQFASAVEAVMHHYPSVRKAIGAAEKIFEYIDRKPEVPPDGHLEPQELRGHIQFKNVSFSYSGKTDSNSLVLKDVSFELKPGKITAVVGRNSSGKSTCVRLLDRFYQPQSGTILLDGEPLTEYKDRYLHDKVAVVSQDCVLFARSVRENIKYGVEASDEEMFRVAQLASAHNFILKLPNGYDTDAGEKGGQVSGGQKQRIAIARALIRRPKILILDSATSELDTKNECQVNQALLNQTNDCTVLLISRNMSVVEKADHIVVLGDGMVKEQGRHEELLAKNGLYCELVKSENKSFHRDQQ